MGLVVGFEAAEVGVGAFLELAAARAGAAPVHAHHKVAVLGQQLVPEVVGEGRAAARVVLHRLGAGAAVHVHQHRVFFGGVKVGGLYHPAV